MRLLAGDVGGTKTKLAVLSSEAGPRAPLAEGTFASAHYGSLEAIVGEFLERAQIRVERASFGVAGPVVGGRAHITNLPWEMDERQLQSTLGVPSVRLLNDLAAIAHAVPHLQPDELHTLNAGRPVRGGAIAIVAPGTGLGEGFLTWDGQRYHPHASEGGHTDFGPLDATQEALRRYLQVRFGHVSYERVCSGQAIPHLYAFFKDSGQAAEPGWLAEQLATADDPVPVIIAAALDQEKRCPLCAATLEIFVAILGAEAGNLALKVLAEGGVYLGGGIPPRILPALEQKSFLEAFQSKGRMADLLKNVPLHVIVNPEVGLLGAAWHGLEVGPELA